jgi:predicted metal-dependent peptidase
MKKHKTNINNHISNTINRMLIDGVYGMPFYGQLNLMVNFRERTKDMPTCGVNVSKEGMNFYYNPDFIDDIIESNDSEEGQKQINFIVLHENFHLLFNHPNRVINGKLDPRLSNIAQDMIINSIIVEEISPEFISIPKYTNSEENIDQGINGKNMALFLPKEYDGEPIFEELYNWLKEKKENQEENSPGDTNKQGDNSNQSSDNQYGPFGKSGDKTIDTFSVDSILDNLDKTDGEYMDQHLEDEVSGEYKNTIVKDTIDKLKSRGFTSGGLDRTLNKLRKKRKDYLKEIKNSINHELVGKLKSRTITRPNRRGIKGIKGKKKYSNKINVVFDTSGSMIGQFEKVLEYIFQNDIEINIFHVDVKVNKVETIKSKKEMQDINVSGMGGTILQPAINEISNSKKYNSYNNVILTDGYTDNLDLGELKGYVIGISCGGTIPIVKKPKKGYKEIIVDD